MDLPTNIKFNGVLIQGGAFKARIDSFNDPYPRYYFVLNINPQNDEVLVLSSSTTDFRSHENCESGDVVHICLTKEDYEEFTKPCIICCDRPKKISKAVLEAELESKGFSLLRAFPESSLQQVLEGILKSKVVTGDIKALVLGDDE